MLSCQMCVCAAVMRIPAYKNDDYVLRIMRDKSADRYIDFRTATILDSTNIKPQATGSAGKCLGAICNVYYVLTHSI